MQILIPAYVIGGSIRRTTKLHNIGSQMVLRIDPPITEGVKQNPNFCIVQVQFEVIAFSTLLESTGNVLLPVVKYIQIRILIINRIGNFMFV